MRDANKAVTAPKVVEAHALSMLSPTIAELVRHHALRAPTGVALRWPARGYDRDDPQWTALTWSELDRDSDALARGMARHGIAEGDRVGIFFRTGSARTSLVVACWKLGASAVVASRRIEPRGLLAVLRRSRPKGLVAGVGLHALRPLFRSAFSSVTLAVGTEIPWFWGGPRLVDLSEPEGPPVVIAATPAMEALVEVDGQSAGRILTHAQLVARGVAVGGDQVLETDGARVWGHLGTGVSTVFPKGASRRVGVVREWRAVLERYDVTTLVGGLEVFGRPPEPGPAPRTPALHEVRAVGGLLPGHWIDRWRRQLGPTGPFSVVWQTEATGPVASIEASEVRTETLEKTRRGLGYCVGRSLDGVDVCIVTVTEAPIVSLDAETVPPGTQGEIVVRGPGVVIDYLDPEIQDRLVVEEKWLRTGWVGYRDEDGRLWLCSNKAHLIETASGSVAPLAVEGLFEGDADVVRSGLVGVGPRGSEVAVLVVQLERGREPSEAREAEWRAREAATPHRGIIRRFLFHPALPLAPSGRLDRETLRAWAAARCADLVRETP